MDQTQNTVDAAQAYIRQGYRPVPIPAGSKGPRIKDWPLFMCAEDEAIDHFSGRGNIGIILGCGLVCVDLDHPMAGQLADQYLPPSSCVVGRPGNPRSHWFYRVDNDVLNKSLRYKSGGKWITVIDILSDGKQVVVGPSVHPEGDIYDDLIGEPATVTADELMAAVLALFAAIKAALVADGEIINGEESKPKVTPPPVANGGWAVRPGDDYNARGDVRGLLIRHGWTQVKEGENEHWRRPGKTEGTSATLRSSREFYNFSPNSPGLMPDKCYSPFALFAALEHRGDFAEAAKALAAAGYGEQLPDVDLSGILGAKAKRPNSLAKAAPAEPFPEDCLSPPGLIGDIIRHNLRTASNPQPILALSGALALMSVILGNKVRSFPNNHTYPNLFVLALAPTGAGKDHARRLNRAILDQAGAQQLRGAESIGSAAGIISALDKQSVLLMQIDEIADLLVTLKNATRSPHLYQISPVLKQLKTSAGAIYKGPALKHEENLKELSNPHLVLYGTSVPGGFWEAVTTSQVTDGLLGRFLIFEATSYARTVDASADDIPADIIDRAHWWANLATHAGNLAAVSPRPFLIAHTHEARTRAIEHAKLINARQIVEHGTEPQRAALWARTAENTNQLALLCACSRMLAGALPGDIDKPPPMIEIEDVDWAIKLSNWLTRNLVQKVAGFVGETPWEITLKKMLRAIPDEGISQYGLRRMFRMLKGRELPDAIAQLVEGGDIAQEPIPGGGRTANWIYRTDSGYKPFEAGYKPPETGCMGGAGQ